MASICVITSYSIHYTKLYELIVEDEPKTGDYLRQGLSEAGYTAELARTGTDGLHLALTGDHDLMIRNNFV